MVWVVRDRRAARTIFYGQSSGHRIQLFLLTASAADIKNKGRELHLKFDDLFAFQDDIRKQFGPLRTRRWTLLNPWQGCGSDRERNAAIANEILSMQLTEGRDRPSRFLGRFGLKVLTSIDNDGYMNAPTRLVSSVGEELCLGCCEVRKILFTSSAVPYIFFASAATNWSCGCGGYNCCHCATKYVLLPLQHLFRREGKWIERFCG